MTVSVHVDSQDAVRFEDVEGFSFYTGHDNNTGRAVAQWTKYQEEGRGSEDWVNLDPSMLTISSVDVFNGELQAFARSIK